MDACIKLQMIIREDLDLHLTVNTKSHCLCGTHDNSIKKRAKAKKQKLLLLVSPFLHGHS